MRVIHAIFWAIYLTLAVGGVELMINQNNITGVNTIDSVGQYVPLTMGLCSFIVCLYQIVKAMVVGTEIIAFALADKIRHQKQLSSRRTTLETSTCRVFPFHMDTLPMAGTHGILQMLPSSEVERYRALKKHFSAISHARSETSSRHGQKA